MSEKRKFEQNLQLVAARLPNTMEGTLGIEMVEANEDQIILRMPITPAARQPFGLVHGGVYMVLAESAAGWHACMGVDLEKEFPVGIEISGSHLRAAEEGHLKAVARVLRRSRKLVVHQVDLFHEESGKLLSVARVTNYYKRVRA